jgi:hypothetical protein
VIVPFRHPGRLAAVLIALLMLSYASVRSTVMQVAMASPAAGVPMCGGDAPAMAMGALAHAAPARAGKATPGDTKNCPYCAAAAHPPLASQPAPPLSSGAVQFVAYRVRTLHGARGPPARRPRARDPPVSFLSV